MTGFDLARRPREPKVPTSRCESSEAMGRVFDLFEQALITGARHNPKSNMTLFDALCLVLLGKHH